MSRLLTRLLRRLGPPPPPPRCYFSNAWAYRADQRTQVGYARARRCRRPGSGAR